MPYILLNMPVEVQTRDLGRNPFRIGDWLVEPSLNRISRGEETTQFELKWMDALVCLAEKAGEVVSRIEIIDRVWATEFITDNTLTHTIAEIRSALGDDARNPTFIETIRQRGYRLIAPVKPAVSEEQMKSRVAKFPVRVRPFADDERSPYPGLAAFTEDDAEFFFGRETEVARMWRKLTSRRMLAVIGPSGVGKSSFLRAGVIPARPEGWGVAICQPGEAPYPALARALVPDFADDVEAMAQLVDIRQGDRAVAMVSRWRARHQQALLVVDQFEELFTQNAEGEQRLFADLLGRLVTDWDLHVLLAMRDDFLCRCNLHEPLRPIFDALMPLEQPGAEALRRALVEPAVRLGIAYEDDDLPGEMVAEVEGERGALPLLAFAVARLWDERDREQKLMTRRAYAEIGGVVGALARHAETTLKAIGDERLPIVRELFRNLVTAEGTRAVREWNELLSIFSDSQGESPEEVLRLLIDARLLTSFEEEAVEGDGRRRVEVVHETLLSSWPRLVRWQTQDADAVQFRDQLRQAARIWDEHGRIDDTLWTGSTYREFTVWREGYPGGLTEVEEDFATAMTSLATRRRRRRRFVAAAVLALTLVVAVVFGTLWRRGVLETRRAEAAKLLAIAQVQIDTDPTEALAYATASLELADAYEARVFATWALWAGPPVRALDIRRSVEGSFWVPTFSPDGRWLAVAGLNNEQVLVYGERGGDPIILGGHVASPAGPIGCAWSRDGLLVTGHGTEGRVRVWKIPEGQVIHSIDFGRPVYWQVGEKHLFAQIGEGPADAGRTESWNLTRWKLPDGAGEHLGWVDFGGVGASSSVFDLDGEGWLYTKGDGIYSRPLPVKDGAPDRMIARHSSDGALLRNWGRPAGIYSVDSLGETILWTTVEGTSAPGRRLPRPETATTRVVPDPSGRWFVEDEDSPAGQLGLWDLTGLREARPRALRRSGWWHLVASDFHPTGDWVVANTRDMSEVSFWPLSTRFPDVVDGGWAFLGFTSDGRYLVTHNFEADQDGMHHTRLWPVPGSGSPEIPDLRMPLLVNGMDVDANNEYAVNSLYGSDLLLIPLSGKEPRRLEGFPPNDLIMTIFSPSGRLVAGAAEYTDGQPSLRVWDLETGETRVFDQPTDPEAASGRGYVNRLEFADEDTLYTSGTNGLLRWNLETGHHERIRRAPPGGWLYMSMASEGQKILLSDYHETPDGQIAALLDLESGELRDLEISGHGALQLSPDGTLWLSAETDGSLRVGHIEGGDPYLLLGHEGSTFFPPAISPDNRWVASQGTDKTLRLWPMPDLSKPPLHTLPHDELIAKLHSLTNIRVVRDEESSTGWKVEVGPFPGWETVPEW